MRGFWSNVFTILIVGGVLGVGARGPLVGLATPGLFGFVAHGSSEVSTEAACACPLAWGITGGRPSWAGLPPGHAIQGPGPHDPESGAGDPRQQRWGW